VPQISVYVPDEIARSIDRQAARLLIGRRAYVRALHGAAASEIEREAPRTRPAGRPDPEPTTAAAGSRE